MHFTLPQPGPNHSKFNPKKQDFKRVLDLNCKTEQPRQKNQSQDKMDHSISRRFDLN